MKKLFYLFLLICNMSYSQEQIKVFDPVTKIYKAVPLSSISSVTGTTTNSFSTDGNIATSNLNGVISSDTIINTITNNYNTNTGNLTIGVNGKQAISNISFSSGAITTTANVILANSLSTGTSTVNGLCLWTKINNVVTANAYFSITINGLPANLLVERDFEFDLLLNNMPPSNYGAPSGTCTIMEGNPNLLANNQFSGSGIVASLKTNTANGSAMLNGKINFSQPLAQGTVYILAMSFSYTTN